MLRTVSNLRAVADMLVVLPDPLRLPDPFAEDSALKNAPIKTFPKEMFFVLRTTQLLRGLANGMDIEDFSCASQWVPFAKKADRDLKGLRVRPLP